jgi:hypothetical protein
MVKAKKNTNKKARYVKEEEEEEDELEGGASLDDAFADDEDVEYAPSKPKKEKKKKKNEELEEEIEEAEEEVEKVSSALNGASDEPPKVKASKPIAKIKKGDRIKVDGKEYTVDQHYVLIDHGTTKEMAIEIYDMNEKDYQIRYFNDQVETTLQFYELQEIMFIKKPMKAIEW